MTKIHSMSIKLPELAPRLKWSIRLAMGTPPLMAMAYILAIMKATVSGIL